jgi:hypothetical protein
MALQIGHNTAVSMTLGNHGTHAYNTNTNRNTPYRKANVHSHSLDASVVSQAAHYKFPIVEAHSTASTNLVSETALLDEMTNSGGHFDELHLTNGTMISVDENQLNDVIQLPTMTGISSVTREVCVHLHEDGSIPITVNEHVLTERSKLSPVSQQKVIIVESTDSTSMSSVTGLLPGDQLVKVDGSSVEMMSCNEAWKLIVNNLTENGVVCLTVSPLTELRELSLRSDRYGKSIAVFKHCASTGSLKRTASLRHLPQSPEVCTVLSTVRLYYVVLPTDFS